MNSALSAKLLQTLAPWRNAPAWRVAFSGGLDSTVLLHLLASLDKTEHLPPLSAIHIHHGLQAAAHAWPPHCQTVCDALGVPLHVVRVQVQPGASLERAARDARYQAFINATSSGELLLTGQHLDDQAETLLFRLLRGAGVRGLASMPQQRPLGEGHLLRPLLDVPRATLEAYAREQRLSWIEDPSNNDQQFSRNYLRHRVLPVLTERWPRAAATIARSAEHLSEAQVLLDELAQMDQQAARPCDDFSWLPLPSLLLAPITQLSEARQRNLLRHWLAPMTSLPDSDHWAGWNSLRDAAGDGRPVWRLAGGELHRSGGRIWWLSGAWLQPVPRAMDWESPDQPLVLPGNGRVQFIGQRPGGILQIRYREGGEVMQLAERGHRDLKRLLNENAVPACVRDRLPLLYRNTQLIAVANLPGLGANAHEGWQLQWTPPSGDLGLS